MTRADQDRTTPSQLLEQLMESVGLELRVSIPGRITKVESQDPPTVTVAPGIRRARESGDDQAFEDDPEIPGVPVQFPRSGGATINLPIAAGNPVTLLVSDRDLDGWLAINGARTVEAGDPRTHDLADCVAIPWDPGDLPTGAAGNIYLGDGTNYLKMENTGVTTLEATTIGLGAAAANFAIKGTAFNTAHATLLGVFGTAFAALAIDPALLPATKNACGAVAVALATYLAAVAGFTSTKVKVE